MTIASKAATLVTAVKGFGTAVDTGKEPNIPAGTASQYRRGDETWQPLNKAAVGLSNVDNTSDANKPVSTAQAQRIEQEISASIPVGLRGQIPFVKQDNTRKTELDSLIKFGEFVESAAELTDSQSRVTTMATVFNEWTRFSHDSTNNQPANAAETNNWAYDSATDSIRCTVNSGTYIGFVSTKKYDSYVHEVRLSSTNADDDTIGVVIAYAVDATGRQHTLSAVRSCGGNLFTWRLVYNLARSDAKVITDKSGTIKWGNGAYGATTTEAGYTSNPTVGGWDDFPTGTLVKITRDGDIIKAITTDLGSDAYVPGSEIIVDLTSDPVLSIFRGPTSYGFSAQSQDASTYKVLQFSEIANVIYDLRDGKVYIHNGSAWVQDATRTLDKDIGMGRLLFNKASRKLYYAEAPGVVVKLAG